MAKQLSDILKAAAQVRDEKTPGANTAERVGGVLTDIVNRITEYPGLSSYQINQLGDISFLSFYDVGNIHPNQAVEKVLREDELVPFSIIYGFYPDGESPYLLIGNSKGIYDGVEWGHEDGSDRYRLPFTALVLEAEKIYVQVSYIVKEGEDGTPYIDETFSGPTLIDLSIDYADAWHQNFHDLEIRLADVERKLKELTASTQA